MAGTAKAVQEGASGSGHQVMPLEGARNTFDDRERGPEFVRHGGNDGGFPKGQIALLVGQTKLSISLAPKASGRRGDDTEQRDVQDRQTPQEHQIQSVAVTRDGGLDRSVRKVELERARRRRFARERQGNVDLEQLAIASVPDVLLLREIGDLGGDVPVQRLLELIGGGKGPADELGVVRIHHAEIAAPDLDPRDLLTDQPGMKGLVESLETLLCEPLAEVVRFQLGPDVESSNERGQLPGARQRWVPDLHLERLREDQAEEHDRDQAHESELAQQAEPRQANGDRKS